MQNVQLIWRKFLELDNLRHAAWIPDCVLQYVLHDQSHSIRTGSNFLRVGFKLDSDVFLVTDFTDLTQN